MTTDVTTKLTSPISDQPMYLLKGAIGGYVGAYAVAKYEKIDNIDPMGRFMVESALAGAVGDYLWLLMMGVDVDTDSAWKGVAVGAVAQLIYNRWLKGYVTGIYE